jgi:hypothetical protein
VNASVRSRLRAARFTHVPTVYLIKERGLIRRKMLGDPASTKFNATIDQLVAAALLKRASATDRP